MAAPGSAAAAAASAPGDFVVIDGSLLEGGGQILRNCFALAAILQKPVHISRIRAGLRPQHLTSLQLVNSISPGDLQGARSSSFEVKYSPRAQAKGGEYTADTQTAGSITLMIQAVLPGGTDTKMSPPLDTVTHALIPTLARFGVQFDVTCVRRGFYPRGQGQVQVRVQPVRRLNAVEMVDRGDIVDIRGDVFSHDLPSEVAKRLIDTVKSELRDARLPVKAQVEWRHLGKADAVGVGIGVTYDFLHHLRLIATTSTGCLIAADALGEKGLPAEEVGRTVAQKLVKNLAEGGCLDEHMQDQVIIYMALASGVSRIRIGEPQLHTRTAMHFSALMTGAEFTCEKASDVPGTWIVTCKGIGWVNPAVGAAS